MENAHLRMGKLKFVRQTRDTITEVSLHLDRLVAEKPVNRARGAGSFDVCVWRRSRGRRYRSGDRG